MCALLKYICIYIPTPLDTDDDKEYKEAAWAQDEVGGYHTYVDANEENSDEYSKSEGQGKNGNGLNVLKMLPLDIIVVVIYTCAFLRKS